MYAPTRLAGYAVLVATPLALLARALFAGDTSAVAVGVEGGLVLAAGGAAAASRSRRVRSVRARRWPRSSAARRSSVRPRPTD